MINPRHQCGSSAVPVRFQCGFSLPHLHICYSLRWNWVWVDRLRRASPDTRGGGGGDDVTGRQGRCYWSKPVTSSGSRPVTLTPLPFIRRWPVVGAASLFMSFFFILFYFTKEKKNNFSGLNRAIVNREFVNISSAAAAWFIPGSISLFFFYCELYKLNRKVCDLPVIIVLVGRHLVITYNDDNFHVKSTRK